MSSLEQFHNKIKAAASTAAGQIGQPRWGVVTSSRQTDTGYEAKVLIQPEGVLSGWLPVLSPFVGGGWGLVCPPVEGQQAFVVPDTGDANHGVIVGLTFSTANMPPKPGKVPVKPGQFALVHQNGSYLHFNDDDVLLVTNRDLNVTVGRDATVAAANQVTVSSPTVTADADGKGGKAQWTLTADLHVSGDVYDSKGPMSRLRTHYDNHVHTDAQGGSVGPTSQPD